MGKRKRSDGNFPLNKTTKNIADEKVIDITMEKKKNAKKKKKVTSLLSLGIPPPNPSVNIRSMVPYEKDYQKDEEDKIACPCCMSTMLEIYQCSESHPICKNCFEKLKKPVCPTCRVKFPVLIRNRLAEALCKALIVKCPTCQDCYLPYEEMKRHQDECKKPLLICWHCSEFRTKDPLVLLQHYGKIDNIITMAEPNHTFNLQWNLAQASHQLKEVGCTSFNHCEWLLTSQSLRPYILRLEKQDTCLRIAFACLVDEETLSQQDKDCVILHFQTETTKTSSTFLLNQQKGCQSTFMEANAMYAPLQMTNFTLEFEEYPRKKTSYVPLASSSSLWSDSDL